MEIEPELLQAFVYGIAYGLSFCVLNLAIRIFKKLGGSHSPDL